MTKAPVRILTAVPICDGHDSAINTVNMELVRAGIEVIYLGYHRPAAAIARAAVQEDVAAVGISSYNGGHVEFFAEVVAQLRRRGGGHIDVFGGGGGTITAADARRMSRAGVGRIFFAGTPLAEIVAYVTAYAKRRPSGAREDAAKRPPLDDRAVASRLSRGAVPPRGRSARPWTIGITGPGGAGKTTLIDELVRRHLAAHPASRIAILSHDPSLQGQGALLGDRATMIHAQDDRVFIRSLATHGTAGGVAASTLRSLEVLRALPFDVVIVETVGIGQEAVPFPPGMVDRAVLVMSPDYGARLQLQKIVMLDVADVVVVNKGDLPGAPTAVSEIGQRLRSGGRIPLVIGTVAKSHRDPGVDRLVEAAFGDPAGSGSVGGRPRSG